MYSRKVRANNGVKPYFSFLKNVHEQLDTKNETFTHSISQRLNVSQRTVQRKLKQKRIKSEDYFKILSSAYEELGIIKGGQLDHLFDAIVFLETRMQSFNKSDFLSLPNDVALLVFWVITMLSNYLGFIQKANKQFDLPPETFGAQEMLLIELLRNDIRSKLINGELTKAAESKNLEYHSLPNSKQPDFPLIKTFRSLSEIFSCTQDELAEKLDCSENGDSSESRRFREWQNCERRFPIEKAIKFIRKSWDYLDEIAGKNLQKELAKAKAKVVEEISAHKKMSNIDRFKKALLPMKLEQATVEYKRKFSKIKEDIFNMLYASYMAHYFIFDLVKKHGGKKGFIRFCDVVCSILHDEVEYLIESGCKRTIEDDLFYSFTASGALKRKKN